MKTGRNSIKLHRVEREGETSYKAILITGSFFFYIFRIWGFWFCLLLLLLLWLEKARLASLFHVLNLTVSKQYPQPEILIRL